MATCYRHPSRETGVSCSNCGRPICPDCMTTTPVGMRCPECSKQRTKVVRMRDMAKRAAGHLRADRDQRRRVPDRAGAARRCSATQHPRARSSTKACCYRAGIAERPVLAARHQRLPAREPRPHRLQHVPAVPARDDARAGDRLASGSRSSTSPSLLAGSFGALFATAAPSRRRLRRDLRADGRGGRGAARTSASA